MNPRSLISELDEVDQMASQVLNFIEKSNLKEEIIIDGNKASVKVDSKLDSIFKDIKKTVGTLKSLFSKTLNTPRNAVTESFLKFYRLVSENSNKILKVAQGTIDVMPDKGLMGRTADYARKTLWKFCDSVNDTLKMVNVYIPDKNYRIEPVGLRESKLVDEFLSLR